MEKDTEGVFNKIAENFLSLGSNMDIQSIKELLY